MKNILILSSLFALLALNACKPEYQEVASLQGIPEAIPVQTETVVLSNEVLPIHAVGILSSSQQIKHTFKIGGIVQSIFVDEGDYFRAGETLAILELSEINAQVSKAKEGLEKWVRDESRITRLYNDSAATLEQLQDINTGLELARADLEIATFNQRYARIVARQPGKVLKRLAEEGELVSPGLPVLVSSNQGQGAFVLKVGLADKDLVRIGPGDTARVSFDALPGESFPATVASIAATATPGIGTFEVELQLIALNRPLRNGFVGVAEIYPSGQRYYYKLPLESVVEAEEQEASIYLADTAAGEARLVNLSLSAIGDDFVLVDTVGVSLNAPVITAGAGFLRPNSKISIQ